MKNTGLKIVPMILAGLTLTATAEMDDGTIIIMEDTDTIILDSGEEQVPAHDEDNGNILIIDDASRSSPTGDGNDIELIEDSSGDAPSRIDTEMVAADSNTNFHIAFEEFWLEYGNFLDSDISADHQLYGHTEVFATWTNSPTLEARGSVRIDGYSEAGDSDWNEIVIDYGETFLRYKTEESIFTIGAQKILWGRIDEFPPIDRLSTQDLRRFLLDDLADRRLASPAVRYEGFFGTGKIDVAFYPTFREAELPNQESIWYPVNTRTGQVLGLELTPQVRNIVRGKVIDDDAPNSEGGAGIRFSNVGTTFDYGLSLQKGRQNIPYFRYNVNRDLIESVYPRTWVAGADIAFEALGGTVKFEAAWSSDVPVTRVDGSYAEVESISWGGALEVFPGDGDMRLNLQIIGQNLIDAPDTFDRSKIYALTGSVESPFANQQWRFKTRFYAGLKNRDFYLNPEIAYVGWENQEIYMDLHYLEGSDGSFGGFYENHNLLTLGWRVIF